MDSANSCSNNVLILKRAIATEGPQDINRLVNYLQQHWGKKINREEASRLVTLALQARQSVFFLDENNLWDFDRSNNQINNMAHQLLAREKQPLSERKLMAEMQLAYKLSEDDIYAQLDLASDHRFRQIKTANSAYWALSRWKIVNNLAFIELLHRDGYQMKIRDLEKHLKKKYDLDKESLFLPEIDMRFRINGNSIQLVSAKVDLSIAEKYRLADNLKDVKAMGETARHALIMGTIPLSIEHPEYISCYLWLENSLLARNSASARVAPAGEDRPLPAKIQTEKQEKTEPAPAALPAIATAGQSPVPKSVDQTAAPKEEASGNPAYRGSSKDAGLMARQKLVDRRSRRLSLWTRFRLHVRLSKIFSPLESKEVPRHSPQKPFSSS